MARPPVATGGGPRNLLGPYEAWMFGPGRTYDLAGLALADQVSLSCVAELPGGMDIARLRADAGGRVHGGLSFRIPALYGPGSFRPRFVPFLMSRAGGGGPLLTLDEVERVSAALAGFGGHAGQPAADPGYFKLNFPVRADTLNTAVPTAEQAALPANPVTTPPPLVIVAVIDHGIPFAHAAFAQNGRTRIDYCWSQGATKPAGDVLFGAELTGAGIDALKARFGTDEEAIYRHAGVLSRPGQPPMPLDGPESHGAHVLSLMGGDWPGATAAQVRIIAVDLPPTSTWETSGFGTDMFILSALHYIFTRADRIARAHGLTHAVPVVLNLSYGYSGGPQDNSGFLESAMDELITERRKVAPTALVMPSGNIFQDRLTALITADHFPDGAGNPPDPASLEWFAPPDDRTSSFLELWYPPETSFADINVGVFAPNSTVPANPDGRPVALEEGRFWRANLVAGGKIVGQYSIDRHRDRRWRVTVILAPTAPGTLPDAAHRAAPAGVWQVKITPPAGCGTFPPDLRLPDGRDVKGGIECRVQIDTNSLQGNTGARQSWFVDPDYDPYAPDGSLAATDPAACKGKVRRFGSINGMAATRTALVVAGYDASSRRAADYSSAGAFRAQAAGPAIAVNKQVDLSAPTERSPFSPGIRAAGTRSGATAAMSGTSVAAPQVARELAAAFLARAPGAGDDGDNYLALLANRPGVEPTGPGDDFRRLGSLRLLGVRP